MMLDYLSENEIPFIIAATKSDKLNKTERAKFFDIVKNVLCAEKAEDIILFSAKNRKGQETIFIYAVSNSFNI